MAPSPMEPTFSILIPAHAKPNTLDKAKGERLQRALQGHRHSCVSPAAYEPGRILDIPSYALNPLLGDLHEVGFNIGFFEMRACA